MQQGYSAPQFAHAPFVVMPASQSNGLGVFAFFVSLVGLFIPTGVVALLGLVLGLAAIGRQPRGFATSAVMIGLLGTVLWLGVMIIAVLLGIVGVVAAGIAMAGAFVITQPEVLEVTSDMVNMAMAVEEYEREHGEMPTEAGVLTVGTASLLDPWGGRYQFVLADDDRDLSFDFVSGGPDKVFDTEDDIALSRLDEYWEDAINQLDHRMNEFGERMERLQVGHHRSSCRNRTITTYERAAHRALDRCRAVVPATPIRPAQALPPAPPEPVAEPAPPAPLRPAVAGGPV